LDADNPAQGVKIARLNTALNRDRIGFIDFLRDRTCERAKVRIPQCLRTHSGVACEGC
jgi:hypothetical protein